MSRRPRMRSVVLSLLLSAVVLLPSAFFVTPPLMRWRTRHQVLRDLTAAPMDRRERALNDLIARAAGDDRLLRGAAMRLRGADAINVLQILNALRLAEVLGDERVVAEAARRMVSMKLDDLLPCHGVFLAAQRGGDPRLAGVLIAQLGVAEDDRFGDLVASLTRAGQWRCPPVPVEAYLRWLRLLAAGPDAASRAVAARRGAEAAELADEHGLWSLFDQWLEDPSAVVRREALLGAVELAGSAENRKPLLSLIARARGDDDVVVARRAWLLLDQFEAVDDAVLPLDARPAVAAAMLWTQKLPADQLDNTLRTMTDDDVRRRLVGIHAYVSSQRRGESDRDAIVARLAGDQVDQGMRPMDAAAQIKAWRLLLALRRIDGGRPRPDSRRLLAHYRDLDAADPVLGPLAVVAAHCDPTGALADTPAGPDESLRRLAAIEALRAGVRPVDVAPDAPPLLTVMTVAVTSAPHPDDLRAALASDEPTLRDLACTIAARRFDRSELSDLVEALLSDFNDHAKRSGAILAGLSKVHGDLLREKMAVEDVWTVKQIHRLGMWMQGLPVHDERGRRIDMAKFASTLLARDDLPHSTILLAMLHVRQVGSAAAARPLDAATAVPLPRATSGLGPGPNRNDLVAPLEMLLHPRHADWVDLREMLATQRWWYVLRPYLRPDAPPLWLWADRELQAFQIEVLRCWYLVNRRGDE